MGIELVVLFSVADFASDRQTLFEILDVLINEEDARPGESSQALELVDILASV